MYASMKERGMYLVFALVTLTLLLVMVYNYHMEAKINSTFGYTHSGLTTHRGYKIIYLYTKKVKNYARNNVGPGSKCGSLCLFTTDARFYNTADMVVFHSDDFVHLSPDDLPDNRPAGQFWVFHTMESPVRTYRNRYNHLGELPDIFNLTMTYSTQADIQTPYAETVKGNAGPIKNLSSNKSKSVLWFVSHYIEFRIKYALELGKFITIDVYGDCGKRDPCQGNQECLHSMKSQYKFYLAFENSVCDDYLTEKVWSALTSGTVPIVMGTNYENYQKLMPPYSFIHIDNFKSPQQLAEYLKYLEKNLTAYDEYHVWRQSYAIKNKIRLCAACEVAHNLPLNNHRYTNISYYWSKEHFCIDPYKHEVLKNYVSPHLIQGGGYNKSLPEPDRWLWPIHDSANDTFCHNNDGNRRDDNDEKVKQNGRSKFTFI